MTFFCRGFDTSRQGFLGWFETLIGLACLEPTTPHGGSPAEFRCRYIFRYYDRDCDGMLNWEEFRYGQHVSQLTERSHGRTRG